MNGPLKKGKDKSNNLLSGPQQRSKNKPRNPFRGPHKKEAFAISLAILIALLVLLVTHVSTESNSPIQQNQPINQTTEIPTQIYSAGGISLQYPSSWNITTDEVNETNTQIVIQDPTSANNPQSTQISAFTILKVQNDSLETLEQRKNDFIQSFTNSGANIALTGTSNVTISGINATEAVYAGNDPKYNKIQLKVIYFQQNNMFYILGFFTKGTDLQNQDPYFNIILNSFKIQ